MNFEKAYDLIYLKLTTWAKDLIKLLPNIALAILVFIIGLYVSSVIQRLSRNFVARFSRHSAVNNLVVSFIYLICISVSVFVALSILQLDKAVTSLLAGAGIVGLALAFAFQDIAANFISGIFISFRRPLRIGDIVKVKDYIGRVQDINLRDTVIQTFQGQFVILPNKDVFQNPIENYSLLGKRRMDLTVGVSYGEDLVNVREIVLNAIEDVPHRTIDPVTFFYLGYGDSSINFEVRIWLTSAEQLVYLGARSEAIIRIKKAFDQNNITIPFPIRTLDFGIKGGKTLSEMKFNLQDDEKR